MSIVKILPSIRCDVGNYPWFGFYRAMGTMSIQEKQCYWYIAQPSLLEEKREKEK
jgi:hypothetical protein